MLVPLISYLILWFLYHLSRTKATFDILKVAVIIHNIPGEAEVGA